MPIEPTTGVDWGEFVKQFQSLKGEITAPTSSVIGGTYDIPTLQTDIENARGQLQVAESALSGYYSKRYSEEYGKAGLETIKNKVADIDSKITNEKTMRDESVSKVRRNPYYSAANITGEVAEIEKAANSKINNLIEQRNSSASEYNATLGEMTSRIAKETEEKERAVEDLRYNLNWMTNQLTTYQTIRSQELSRTGEQEQWAMEFATKLAAIEEDRKRWEKEYELEEYRTYQPETPGAGKGLQSIEDDTGRVIGYFNPNTGETHYYTKEEMPTAAPTSIVLSEKDFKSKVAAKIKAGESLESMRDNPETAGIVIKPPSTKTATQIIEEEWAKAHPTGWWGKFLKFLPGGY